MTRRKELAAVYWTAVVAVLLASVPYLAGWALRGSSPDRAWYSGFVFGVPDNFVYQAWAEHAARGHFFERDLFTTAAPAGLKVNLYYDALGALMRLSGLPYAAVFQLLRLALGVLLVRAVWWLIGLLVEEEAARRPALLCACFSAGLGWIFGLAGSRFHPTDLWQPEGFTFFSLYWSQHYLLPLILMIGMLGWLFAAEKRRDWRPAVWAGLCGLLLADIHTYDLVPLALAWGAFLLAETAAARRWSPASWARGLLAGAIAAPGVLYMALVLARDPVFAERVAVLTRSPSLATYLAGYGLLVPLALLGARRALRAGGPGGRLLACWAAANLAAAYAPVSFQRKLVMGLHLPVALLAGIGLCGLLERLSARRRRPALAGAVLLLSLTNLFVLVRECRALREGDWRQRVRPYLFAGERSALDWLRERAPEGAAFQPLPWIEERPGRTIAIVDVALAGAGPALTGHPVACGHVGETPDFMDAVQQWAGFSMPDTPDAARRELLKRSGVSYLVFSQKAAAGRRLSTGAPLFEPLLRPPPYLRLVPEASGPEADLFEVRRDLL